MSNTSTCLKMALAVALGIGAASSALAEDDEGHSWWKWGKSEHSTGDKYRSEGGSLGTSAPPVYQKECASCHMAYPAGLLPAGSWQNLMGNLGQHFGSDASLDAASVNAISQYLTSSAGTYKRVNEMPPQDRITQSNWFQRKHNKHVSASTWARPAIGSASNCVACHAGAEQGNFNEHSVRIPN